jgi:hypothetical protein
MVLITARAPENLRKTCSLGNPGLTDGSHFLKVLNENDLNPFFTMTTFFDIFHGFQKKWVWFRYFGIPLFLFFKILIVNQDTRVFQYFYVSMLHFYFCTYTYVLFFSVKPLAC